MFPCKIAFRQLSPEFSFYRIPLFEACSRRASARPFLSAIRKVCLAKLLPFQVITPAKEKDFSSISHHYKFKLNSVFSLFPCFLVYVFFQESYGIKYFFFLKNYLFGCIGTQLWHVALRHVGSQFPDQGLNLCPLHFKVDS